MAVVQAVVVVRPVAIIANLKPRFTLGKIEAENAVTAASWQAFIGASVIVLGVAIIADFDAFPELTIAAALEATSIGTVIHIDLITIITFLPSRPDLTVAAAGQGTTVQAVIGSIIVTVIAFLEALSTRLQVGSLNAITTASWNTCAGAGIQVLLVAIVTGFCLAIGPHDAVATEGQDAGL
ncbi:MAG: hypothetical protein CMH55_02700 [Myxococcales bacterium]|nr:hypothetical protein [Myxococcales bacterium]